MAQTRLIILSAIILLQLLFCPTINTMLFKIFKIECDGNSKFVINLKCRLRAINRDKSVINMDFDIVDVIENFFTHVQVWQKNSMNIYRPFLVNITENACDILDKRKSHFYTRLAFNILKEFTNINHTCPYRGHIFAKNFYVDQRLIPVSPPAGIYKIVTRLFQNSSFEHFFTFIYYIEISNEK